MAYQYYLFDFDGTLVHKNRSFFEALKKALQSNNYNIDDADIQEALEKALAYEGKTNGRDRIIEMGLSNEQVAQRLIKIYQSLV